MGIEPYSEQLEYAEFRAGDHYQTMARPADPRDSGRWRTLRATAVRCAICSVLLDRSNPRGKRYPQVDHVVPVDARPDLAFALSNLRVLCASCNASTGAAYGNRTRRKRGATHLPRRWQPPQSDGGPGIGW